MSAAPWRPWRWSLPARVLLALIAGAVAAVVARALALGPLGWSPPQFEGAALRWIHPIGDLFLRGMLVCVVPLVFASLALGIYRLGDLRALGRIGLSTFAVFTATSLAGAVIASALVSALRPGTWVPAGTRDRLAQADGADQAPIAIDRLEGSPLQLIVGFVPDNVLLAATNNRALLQVIVFAILFGAALIQVAPERARPVADLLDGLSEAMGKLIELVMKLAPVGVFCLVFTVVARFGPDVLGALAAYTGVVLLALAVQVVAVQATLARLLGGRKIAEFFRAIRQIALTAFSTSSSSATLPTSLRVVERELGVSRPVASFVLPLGATTNMDGTTIYQIVAVHFVAQVWGVPLDWTMTITLIFVCLAMGVGAAGVPGGVVPLLFAGMSVAGLPDAVAIQGVALVIGVDRILDMCRTTANVIGDAATATAIDRLERRSSADGPPPSGPPSPLERPSAAHM